MKRDAAMRGGRVVKKKKESMIYQDDLDEGLAAPKGEVFEEFNRLLPTCGNRPEDLTAVDASCRAAAAVIADADAILLFAGAGCSADCGLPVYRDIVKGNSTAGRTYRELCDPIWLSTNPEVFFEFFGSCHDLYLQVQPHSGYHVLLKWLGQCDSGSSTEDFSSFVVTSNVDAMFLRAGFPASNVYEFHGNVRRWQCEEGLRCKAGVWTLPAGFRFAPLQAGPEGAQMEGSSTRSSGAMGVADGTADGAACSCGGGSAGDSGGSTPRTSSRQQVQARRQQGGGGRLDAAGARPPHQQLQCRRRECHLYARPNIQMFNDRDYVPNKQQVAAYRRWRKTLYRRARSDPSFRVVVLEVGCGVSVPRLRWESEVIGTDLEDAVTVVRLNLENSDACVLGARLQDAADDDTSGSSSNGRAHFISIPLKAAEGIHAIDAWIERDFDLHRKRKQGKQSSPKEESGQEQAELAATATAVDWVQCEDCGKWRTLAPGGVWDEDQPFTCALNIWNAFNNCSMDEETST